MPYSDENRRRLYLKSPRRKYQEHKQHARDRGVVFTLTFEEWWAVWEESGVWSQRGRLKGQYCMHRIGDRGGYTPGNVYIAKSEANSYACAMQKLHHKPHPDDVTPPMKKVFSGEPGPDVPF